MTPQPPIAQPDLEAAAPQPPPRAAPPPPSVLARLSAKARSRLRGSPSTFCASALLCLGVVALVGLHLANTVSFGRQRRGGPTSAPPAPAASRHADVVPQAAAPWAREEMNATTTAEGSALPAASAAGSSSTAAPHAETSTTTPEPSASAKPETVTAAAVSSSSSAGSTSLAVGNRCYNFISQMNMNALQEYPQNPDSEAFGFATCKLCTGGAMHCTSLLHSGKSRLIAAHIHLADGDSADAGKTAEGAPVVNFCGDNQKGLIDDGTPYVQACSQWDSNGAAHDADMPGTLVENFNKGTTLAQRVEDIAANPGKYYFNFHSLASWNHWYPTPHGICRGDLQLQGADE